MNTRLIRIISIFVAVNLLYEIFFPTMAYALSGGPSQPEVQSFEPVGTSEMVDLFTGDFNYNIPLLDVDGYPVNIAYHSGVTMDQEASWVGLGWNINAGVINRNMRGLPDDFKGDGVNGDKVEKEFYIKPDYTIGIELGPDLEIFGMDVKDTTKISAIKRALTKVGINASSSLYLGYGISYNNYKGVGFEETVNPSIKAGEKTKLGKFTNSLGLNADLRLTSSSQNGLSMTPRLGLSQTLSGVNQKNLGFNAGINMSVGMNVNSRTGLQSLTFSHSFDAGGIYKKYTASTSGLNGGSTISFSTSTYTPQIGMPMNNTNVTLDYKMGAEWIGTHANANFKGYYTKQQLAETKKSEEAYGYMYSEKHSSDDVLLDFNREKDGSWSNESPVLAIPQMTYDLYSVSGQGVGGMYRPHRGEIGVVSDDISSSDGQGGSAGAKYGVANMVKLGIKLNYNSSSSRSGMWAGDNPAKDAFAFHDNDIQIDPLYEPCYFKAAGEKTPVDAQFTANKELNNPVNIPLYQEGMTVKTNGSYLNAQRADHSTASLAYTKSSNRRSARDPRGQLVSVHTSAESANCLDQYINTGAESINRMGGYRKAHHITEITATTSQGMRYVYGIPAYNISQEEFTFTNAENPDDDAHTQPTVDCNTGLVEYTTDRITSYNDDGSSHLALKGNDHYYNHVTTPPYAHSFLLTSVLSPDYIDVTGDGVSNDDFGTATKINYTRTSASYGWRTPYAQLKANYNRGYRSDKFDDAASFLYGSKEMWYMNSIRGKNHTACFYLSRREDGLGVTDSTGTKNTSDTLQRSYKLDSIILYSNSDVSRTSPIKKVFFEYDYSLCPNVDNNSGTSVSINGTNINSSLGKLTLKKIYFTYGNSFKGRFNSYQFAYNSTNPAYNMKGYDRWGNYKPNSVSNCDQLNTSDFPYVDQGDQTTADQRSSAWSLTDITLPSGGSINIQYESDDYAYVQDKRSMQMYKLIGFGSSESDASYHYSDLYRDNILHWDIHDYMFFDLGTEQVWDGMGGSFRDMMMGSNNQLYYNVMVDLTTKGNYESVRGYCTVLDAGVNHIGSDYIGWVKVQPRSIPGEAWVTQPNVNPVSYAAWQFARLHTPYLIYPGSDLRRDPDIGTYVLTIARSLVGIIFDMADMVIGFNDRMRMDGNGRNVLLDHSWIRLNNLSGKKFGGGCRVKQLQVTDNWQFMDGGSHASDFTNGQQYTYTKQDGIMSNGTPRMISSGVASYEPIIGNDENPWRTGDSYTMENTGVPDNEFFTETPYGECFFPAASVGYSKVTVTNIQPANLKRHGTGKTVHEYYTAKDFPVIPSKTDLQSIPVKPSYIFDLIKTKIIDFQTVSQGFQVELNDMHGKPKAVWNYNQSSIASDSTEKAYSGIQYFYLTDPANPSHLFNQVDVIFPNNTIANVNVGVESDMVNDMREHNSESYSVGGDLSVDGFILGFIPCIIGIGFPSISSEVTRFRSAVTSRVINRYGILKKTVAYEEGSSLSTENLLFDSETGEVLLTNTQNEYEDVHYNATYPAHWLYDGMGPAYKNIGATFMIVPQGSDGKQVNVQIGTSVVQPYPYFLTPGDELQITSDDALNGTQVWVLATKGDYGSPGLSLIDYSGALISLNSSNHYKVKVMRSGRRNMQTTPVASVTSLSIPVKTDGYGIKHLSHDSSTFKILNASATEFSQHWRTDADLTYQTSCSYGSLVQDLIKIYGYLLSNGDISPVTIPIPNDQPGYSVYENSFVKYARDHCSGGGGEHTYKMAKGSDSIIESMILNICGTQFNLSVGAGFGSDSLPSSINFLDMVGGSIYEFHALVTWPGGTHITVTGFYECEECDPGAYGCTESCSLQIPSTINPYKNGIMGNWRKKRDWLYLDNRLPESGPVASNLRKDGTYKTYKNFWTYQSNAWVPSNDAHWVWSTEITRYGHSGMESEKRDTLQRYSAAQYGYNNILPVAVASNSRYRQMGFDGCEKEVYSNTSTVQCPSKHFNFMQSATSGNLDTLYQHTGKTSLKLTSGNSFWMTRPLIADDRIIDNGNYEYKLDTSDITGLLSPDTGSYIVSAWVKLNVDAKQSSYAVANLKVVIDGGSGFSQTFYPAGKIVEGWQRIEGIFTVAFANTSIKVILNASSSDDIWFDDIRIHPYHSKMKSYVYDPVTLRLMAELDENNYATFYEYDEQGSLIRVKKETEKGIVTLKESRNSMIKQ